MRKGSTVLGSVGATSRSSVAKAGIVFFVLPFFTGVAGGVLLPRAGWAAESGDRAAEQRQREALVRRQRWLGLGTLRTPAARAAAKKSAGAAGKQARPLKVIHTKATWYGPGFHGRRTANGERFNQYAMTLASRHLPFGTRVRVVNLKTGKAAVARVNDRGPFGKRGYTADLSKGVAQKIGLKGSGPIRLEVLPKG